MYELFASIPLSVRKQAVELICQDCLNLHKDGTFVLSYSRIEIDATPYCPLGVINRAAGVAGHNFAMPLGGYVEAEVLSKVGIEVNPELAAGFIRDVDNDCFRDVYALAAAMGVEIVPAWFEQQWQEKSDLVTADLERLDKKPSVD